jgi:di/tricarboxylate transporter
VSLPEWLQIPFTLSVVVGVLAALIANVGAPDLLFVGATALLAAFGVIAPQEAFAGFANSAVVTVGALFIVAAGLRDTGILDYIGRKVLGNARTSGAAMGRLGGIIITMSALLNNTPIVAMFLPVVIDWCRRHRVSPSKLLIPLSYFAVLGGTCTLIGTSTNLVVAGLAAEAGLPEISLFEMTPVGIPYALVGLAFLYFFGDRLLPNRKELLEQLGESRREFLSEMHIDPACRLVGQTVEVAGLRQLPGSFLIEISRIDGTVISPVNPETMLRAHDRLVFTGIVTSIIELERIPGLNPVTDPAYEVSPSAQQNRRLCEAVISNTSPLIGKSIRDADFRARFGAAVVAVHRGGERVKEKVGDIELAVGDTLLLQTQPHFLRAYRNDPSFYLVSDVEEWRPLRYDRAWISLAIFAALIALMVLRDSYTALWASLAGLALVATGCISAPEARKSIEWQALVMIGASFGVGAALEKSGAAKLIAGGLVDFTQSIGGPMAGLIAIYILTVIVTEIISNNAAAVLMFPFCLETATLFDVSHRPFLMAVLFGASAGFMTPIGYQTHMMVYGPGGYRFSDFIRAGVGMHLVLFPVAITLIPWMWPF